AMILSLRVPSTSILLWGGSLAMPWVLYKLLTRNKRRISFAEVWSEGIASFFLGCLVPAVVVYALLRFAFPDFIANQVAETIAQLKALNAPEADLWVDTLENLREHNGLPGAADIAANIISFNIVVGTILSLLVTPFVRMYQSRQTPASHNNI
ncbi:MAG: DUF4199 domain-containing protein, partial [Muribaculaceae bacterium]|nr:DUF4199 domain-containing protein [Muribaculaceae bacterium]